MKIYRIFSSVRLTNIILPVIIIELIIISFLPARMAWFTSPFFLFPVLVLFINISACTFRRLKKYRSWKQPLKSGADIIHVGILMLMICGMMTPLFRDSASIILSEGDELKIAGGININIEKLDFTTYDDGRPGSWTAVVESAGEVHHIEVNHPLRLRPITIYLTGFGAEPLLHFEDEDEDIFIDPEEVIIIDGIGWEAVEYRQLEVDGWRVVLANNETEILLTSGDEIGGRIFTDVIFRKEAVFMLVKNPLKPVLYTSFVITALGLILVMIDKSNRRTL